MTATDTSSRTNGIYCGFVVHERMRPRRHRLKYSVFSLLLDVDTLSDLSKNSRLLGYNRRAFFSIRDADHGDGNGIRRWVEEELSNAGLEGAGYRITMLCYPRILGYVFNPLTVFYCYDEYQNLRAVIYEVHNTFKERHSYVLPVRSAGKIIKQRCDKQFYVSPFIEMDCSYNFFLHPPADKVRVVIREEDKDGLLLAAAFSGDYSDLTDQALLKVAFRYPLMTLKIMAGIHFEALKLFMKGIRYIARTPAKEHAPISATTSRGQPTVNVSMD